MASSASAAKAEGGLSESSMMLADYQHLVPPGCDFEVKFSELEGRFMATTRDLEQGHEYLEEAPLVAWPLATQDVEEGEWCEWCLRPITPATSSTAPSSECAPDEPEDGSSEGRRVRPRTDGTRACEECKTRFPEFFELISAEMLRDWRDWQLKRSPTSCVGLEAFARCAAQVAMTAQKFITSYNLSPTDAFKEAYRPYERLISPPEGSSVELHGTSAKEVSQALLNTKPFAKALSEMLGSSELVEGLLSEAAIDAMAGRLVLNAAGISIPIPSSSTSTSSSSTANTTATSAAEAPATAAAAAASSAPAMSAAAAVRGAGVFVLLSTMNHDCRPSAEAVFQENSTVLLRTTRALKAGEPLTLGYVQGDLSLKERQIKLQHWFFKCICTQCEAEERVESALKVGPQ